MEHFGISPWNDYTSHVALALLAVALLVAILLFGAFIVVNYGLMSRRDRDEHHGGQEPSDPGFLQRERFPEAHAHREYLPAEEGPESYWEPEEEPTVSEEQMLHEEQIPSDEAEYPELRHGRRHPRGSEGEKAGERKKGA